jgi:hypothetical protein
MTENPLETPTEPNDDAPDEAHRPIERAAFLDDFPPDPDLLPLVEAFQSGHYARLRELYAALRTRSKDPETLELARELVERTHADPTATKLLLLSIGFFLFILTWVYGSNGH